MLKIYISSTFEDLKDHRASVAAGLRKLGHHPVNMEDYPSEGTRPLEKCLTDVKACNLYVGIFAHRYGFIPDEPANPNKLSITHLELTAARQNLGDKQCLVFLVDPNFPWPPPKTDSGTGNIDGYQRIEALKKQLGNDFSRGAVFTDPTSLALLVNTAVSAWQQKQEPAAPPERQARQITTDALIGFADPADQGLATTIAAGLAGNRVTSRLAPRALFATSAEEFVALEKEVVRAHSAIVVATPSLLGIVSGLPDQAARAMSLLAARTGALIVACAGVDPASLPKAWSPTKTVVLTTPPSDADFLKLKAEIDSLCPTRGRPTVGLPYVVMSMNATEASDLFEGRDAGAQLKGFAALATELSKSGTPASRYGPDRRQWKPFAKQAAQSLVAEIATRLNSGAGKSGQRSVKLQYYPLDDWFDQTAVAGGIYARLQETGCVAVVDQVSLFHSTVGPAAETFLAGSSKRVAVVAMAPSESLPLSEAEAIERQARDRLAGVFTRFDAELDPTTEFGVAEERRLRRWLRASVPTAMSNVTDLSADESNLQQFRDSIAPQRQTEYTGAIWRDGTR